MIISNHFLVISGELQLRTVIQMRIIEQYKKYNSLLNGEKPSGNMKVEVKQFTRAQ